MEIVKILAWPVVAGVTGIAFFLIFKKAISSLLDRIEKLGKDGISAKPSQPQQSSEQQPQSQFDELMKGLDSIMLREQEDIIEKALVDGKVAEPTKQTKLLVRYLAATQITLIFERIYHVIFGSQIALLQYLNTLPNGDNRENLQPFYIECRKRLEITGDYTFEKYVDYLESMILVRLNGDRYCITQRGREFLEYLVKQGYSTHKWS